MTRTAFIISLTLALAAPMASSQPVTHAPGGVLRVLDKVAGASQDVEVPNGGWFETGGLKVTLWECRYPQDDPSSEAFARLTIEGRSGGSELFNGWMVATSPALNALDHHRYDVWVLRCMIPEGAADSG
ncbi:MAG: DUF2155 domain-containing protein [Pseudomonadota bacterium]